MEDSVLLACQKCGKPRQIELAEARTYNKDKPYTCFDCASIKEEPIEPDQSRIGQVSSIATCESSIDNSPIGQITRTPQPPFNPPRTFSVEDYSPQTEYAKKQMEEFSQRHERLAREELEEYGRGHTGFPVVAFDVGIAITLVVLFFMILLFMSVFQLSTTLDCNTSNTSANDSAIQAWKAACLKEKGNMQMVPILLAVAVLILVIMVRLRMLV